MKDNGVVPKSNVNVVTKQEGDKTIITVTSKKPDETPVFVGAIITPGQLKAVTVTLLDQNNTPVGKTEKAVFDPTTPTLVKFTEPKAAKTLVVELTSSTDKPTNADLASIIACMEVKGILLFKCTLVAGF